MLLAPSASQPPTNSLTDCDVMEAEYSGRYVLDRRGLRAKRDAGHTEPSAVTALDIESTGHDTAVNRHSC